jgi:N-acetyl sugar amidotransferase
MNNFYKRCVRCLMDTSDSEISFDDEGICNHCKSYQERLNSRIYTQEEREEKLSYLVNKIKSKSLNEDYDCIIGVSGGVDSTYVAYLTKKLGLRPLAIHFDNGWNSELAVSNIEKVLKKLDIDLLTYVIDWEEFRDLQKSFLYASTPDGEIPTDHAINALLFREASKRKIKYIINGMNFATESISVKSWAYGHSDWTYIKDVHRKFGNVKLKNYPFFNLFLLFYWTFIKNIKVISILNYIDYNKEDVMEIIQNELDWVYYGGKHYESVYTRFFQGYILPKKFGIDKRKGHLSDLIYSKQITREDALIELEKDIYPSSLFNDDFIFVKKKFLLSDQEFDNIMSSPIKSYKDFRNIEGKIDLLKRFVNYLRFKGLYSK